jgi:hypothetical protein
MRPSVQELLPATERRTLVEDDSIAGDTAQYQVTTYSDALHQAIRNAIAEFVVFLSLECEIVM